MKIYSTPEQIRTLENLMRIREILTRIESQTKGKLSRLSEQQYELYKKYLNLLHETAEELEDKNV